MEGALRPIPPQTFFLGREGTRFLHECYPSLHPDSGYTTGPETCFPFVTLLGFDSVCTKICCYRTRIVGV